MDPKLGSLRPPAPQRWGSTPSMVRVGDQSLSMTWYHVIPYSLLRDVWNRLVDQHIATQLPEARVTIRQYISLVDSRVVNVDELVDRIRAENTTQRRAAHNTLRPLDVAEANQLAAAAVWPAWDVVEGPRARSDDTRDQSLDRFTAGLTASELSQMGGIERLFRAFTTFAQAGSGSGAISLSALSQAMATERLIVSRDLPIRFRAEMWTKDGLPWRKRRATDAAATAR
jgi:hypothetical protein